MNRIYFDLAGTVLKYGTDECIPLMADLLRALQEQNWEVAILSSFTVPSSEALLRHAGLGFQPRILSSAGTTKGAVMADEMRRAADADRLLFIDDKPENLASVREACGGQVRLIGFVGSREYVPQLSNWCAHHQVELAFSAPDLCEGLEIYLDSYKLIIGAADSWATDDLVALIPGLEHPASAGGESAWFDHRPALSVLLDRNLSDYAPLWRNLGWITCNKCIWKALVNTVLRTCAINPKDVLGKAYYHREYTAALKAFVAAHPSDQLYGTFWHALHLIQEGIREIGVAAETCRIARRPIERDRIAAVEARLRECFS